MARFPDVIDDLPGDMRAKQLMEIHSSLGSGSITSDQVRFIEDEPNKRAIAEIFLNDPKGLLSNRARKIVQDVLNQQLPLMPASPYQSAYDTQ